MIFEAGKDKVGVNIILLSFGYFNIFGDPVLDLSDFESILWVRGYIRSG